MFKHWMEIFHHHDNDYLDWLFYENVFPLRESTFVMSNNGKDSHLRNHLEVHSLSFDQVFLTTQKLFESSVAGLLIFFLLNCFMVYFIYL